MKFQLSNDLYWVVYSQEGYSASWEGEDDFGVFGGMFRKIRLLSSSHLFVWSSISCNAIWIEV